MYTPVKVPCEAEISTFLVAFELNIEQRNTRMIISPKGHIPLEALHPKPPRDKRYQVTAQPGWKTQY
jgi:hypothetical protein